MGEVIYGTDFVGKVRDSDLNLTSPWEGCKFRYIGLTEDGVPVYEAVDTAPSEYVAPPEDSA